jgi:hypothetical protein
MPVFRKDHAQKRKISTIILQGITPGQALRDRHSVKMSLCEIVTLQNCHIVSGGLRRSMTAKRLLAGDETAGPFADYAGSGFQEMAEPTG